MPFRCTVRCLLLAAVVCAALLIGPSVGVASETDPVDAPPALAASSAVLAAVDDAVAPPRPVIVRRLLAATTLLVVVALLAIRGNPRRTVPDPSPRPLAAAGHLVRGLRAPPLALPH